METTMQTKYGAFPVRITHLKSLYVNEYKPVDQLGAEHFTRDGRPPEVKEILGAYPYVHPFPRLHVRLTNGFEYHARYEYIPQEGAH